ncbi:MAG: BamA/TamA family outer membrane protein, partial [Planctomycetes bacterium]|nr:BamA/TamA family outer membrane protein [Planctomycetota bacterium]
ISELRRAYDRKGYLDTAISAEQVFNAKKNRIDIIFNVKEGPRYKIERIVISGNKFFDTDSIEKEFRLKAGDYYSEEISRNDAGEILRIYRQIGFVDVSVTHKRSFSGTGKVLSEFKINEGRQFRIGVVNITGNKNVQDKVVRRVLDEKNFKPGELYNAHITVGDGSGELEKEVRSSTYAESVTITSTGEKPDQKDAEVRITEGKTGSIMFGAGVSSQDGLIGQVVYDQRNFDIKNWPKSWREFLSNKAFKGAGQRLRISLEPGTEISEYSISFTEPYFRDKPTSLDVAASSYERQFESYDEQRLRGSFGFRQRRKEGRYRSLGFRFENVNVASVETGAPGDVSKVKGDNLIAGIKLGFGRDMTDSKMNPTKGRGYDISYEQISGDYTFGIASGTYRWYRTLREDLARRKTVLEIKLRAATIVGEAPMFERFYVGGIRSLRGFDYRGISPRSGADNDPVGSDWMATINSEVSIPLVGKSMAALFFADAGMIDTGGPRASIGTGIQIMIPQWFGQVPLRFELAVPFMKDGSDETQVFHFSVGRLF